MSNCTSERQRAADAEIATAMGWRHVTFPPGSYFWHPLGGDGARYALPRFHESHEARATLLEWLAASREYRWLFFAQLSEIINADIGADPMQWMLATPAQVAEAAHRVIQEAGK